MSEKGETVEKETVKEEMEVEEMSGAEETLEKHL